MATMRAVLTEADLRTLVRGESDELRAAAAHKICRRIDQGLTPEERAAASQVLTLMAQDAAELVRRALAVTLKNSPELPRSVALKLAQDIDSIAAPVLAFSPAFSDEDLADIVRAGVPTRQVAIARRAELAEAAASALAEHGCEQAVRLACANDNAALSEQDLQAVLARFGQDEGVTHAIAYRKALPLSVSERLVTLVGEQVRQHLMDHHALTAETAMRIALGARERATMDLVDQAGRAADLKAFCAHLRDQKRLTPSLLLRTLVHGHVPFFEHAVSELSGVTHRRVWLMIHDAGPLGLRAVYERAGLPGRLYPAFRTAIDTFHSLQREGGPLDPAAFQHRLLQRYLTHDTITAPEEVDYLLERMDKLGAARSLSAAGRAA